MNDKQTILDLIRRWGLALEKKDIAGMMEDYLPDALMFDACPPYKVVGAEGIRKVWESCLPYFPDDFKSEHRDLAVHVDGNVAFVHGIHHFLTTPADHPCGKSWMRITIGFKRVDGKWKVAHEHVSIPFNPMTNQTWEIADPNKLDMPDYSNGVNVDE